MVHFAVVGLACLLSLAQAEQTCTSPDNLKGIEKGTFLPGSQILNLTTPGIMTCSRACLMRRRCQSFNFNIETGECQLNSEGRTASRQMKNHSAFVFSDISNWPEKLAAACANHTCPFNSYCDPVNNTHYVCNITSCLDVPYVAHGHLNETLNVENRKIGTVFAYTCEQGSVPQGELICRDDGTWSSPVCVDVSSCIMVKQYQPNSVDGEYWLRLANFDNYTTKIYCHNMSSSLPQEFLTLPNANYGIYPLVMNQGCTQETQLGLDCQGRGGEIWFTKIKVNIITMKVTVGDRTFANVTGNEQSLKYGVAADCYTPHTNNMVTCGTRGRFYIDLRGTGWSISVNQQWKSYGFASMIESIDRQMNGTVISVHCGGFPGGCSPSGGLFLTPLPKVT